MSSGCQLMLLCPEVNLSVLELARNPERKHPGRLPRTKRVLTVLPNRVLIDASIETNLQPLIRAPIVDGRIRRRPPLNGVTSH
jgi:hypothetical protein